MVRDKNKYLFYCLCCHTRRMHLRLHPAVGADDDSAAGIVMSTPSISVFPTHPLAGCSVLLLPWLLRHRAGCLCQRRNQGRGVNLNDGRGASVPRCNLRPPEHRNGSGGVYAALIWARRSTRGSCGGGLSSCTIRDQTKELVE